MLPQFISLGPLSVNIYTMLIGLGAALALGWMMWRTRDLNLLNTALIVGLCAWLAGRLGYLVLYQAPDAAPGLQAHAALLGGWLAHAGIRRMRRSDLPPLPAWGLILLAGLIGVGASIGCIPNACGYGHEVFWTNGGDRTVGWALRVDWPDAYTISNPRWPTQGFAALGIMLLMGAVWVVRRKASAALPLWLAACAVADFGLQFLRADAMPLWLGLRAEQGLDGALLLITVGVMLQRRRAGLDLRRRSGRG